MTPPLRNVTVITTLEDMAAADREVRLDEPVLALVHAPWCAFCIDLRPEWEKVAGALAAVGMQVLEIDVSVVPEARRAQTSQKTFRLLQALERGGDEESKITTVPHVVLYLPTSRKAIKYDHRAYDPWDHEHPDENERPRHAVHMLRFIERALLDHRREH